MSGISGANVVDYTHSNGRDFEAQMSDRESAEEEEEEEEEAHVCMYSKVLSWCLVHSGH